MTEKLDLKSLDWIKVLTQIGIDRELITNPRRTGPCPMCEGKTRFRLENDDGRGHWHCSKCGAGDGVRLVALFLGCNDASALHKIRDAVNGHITQYGAAPVREHPLAQPRCPKKAIRNLRKVWDGAIAITPDTAAWKYIVRRVPGFQFEWLTRNFLRFHPWLNHSYEKQVNGKDVWVRSNFPAIVARVIGNDGRAVSIHRTYLQSNGKKAKVPADQVKKQMTGSRQLNGDFVPVNVPYGNSRVAIVCEGLETALALVTMTDNVHQVLMCLNAGNLAKYTPDKDRFDRVYIAADHDKLDPIHNLRPGEHYAKKLLARVQSDGMKANLRIPEFEGEDFADEYIRLWRTRCARKWLAQRRKGSGKQQKSPAMEIMQTPMARNVTHQLKAQSPYRKIA